MMEDWTPATLNYPMTTGDHLWTDGGSRKAEAGEITMTYWDSVHELAGQSMSSDPRLSAFIGGQRIGCLAEKSQEIASRR